MRLTRHGFGVLLENEVTYFGHLEGLINSIDELASAEVTNAPSSWSFRIVPSIPRYSQALLQSMLEFHTLLGIRLDVGKSIKRNSTVTFIIHKP